MEKKEYKKGKMRRKKEKAIRIIFFFIALASISTLTLIVVFLFTEGLQVVKARGVKQAQAGEVTVLADLFGGCGQQQQARAARGQLFYKAVVLPR